MVIEARYTDARPERLADLAAELVRLKVDIIMAQGGQSIRASAGAHAAVVEVDKATGKVEVLRYLIVGDNGTVINPDVVNGQVYGSAAHGIAVALGEGFMYSAEGQPLTITYLDYGKCSTAETPRVEVIHRPSPSPFTSLGQKAAGEGAAIPSPAAIASALEDALKPFGVKV